MATRRRRTEAAAARLTRVGLGLLQQWGAILSLLGLHLAAATRTAQRAQGHTARRHRCGRERGAARPDPAWLSSSQPGSARLCSAPALLSFSSPRRRSPPARLYPAGAGQRRPQPRRSRDRQGRAARSATPLPGRTRPPSLVRAAVPSLLPPLAPCRRLTEPHGLAHRRAAGVALRRVPSA